MSGFDLEICGGGCVEEQLWLSPSLRSLGCSRRMQLWWGNIGFQRTTSMRLRSKRIGSGVECFGVFLIKRFLFLFLFFRGTLT
ncbi:hypothetical protein GIB67_036823 [Kingdonia uniflora]|uniref:Uncharacterized protein n=1 Tax=Kingdonia uniflora TaxID=39325 RepID=A0A7J7LX19_9MAGN|nr:hypothetical protein GIB67_036823 [Kingdonia uniflora]